MPVVPERNWTSSVNNPLNVTTLLAHQQDSFFQLHTLLKLAGWTVQRSSNGTVAGAADNIASIADVNWNAAGTFTWAVYKSPVGFVPNGNFTYLLLSLDSNNAQTLRGNMSGAPYTGGTTAANPVNANAQSGPGQNTWNTNVLPANSNWNGSYSDKGDVHYGIAKLGSGIMQTSFTVTGLADTQPADGWPCILMLRNQEGDARGGFKRDSYTVNNGMGALWIGGQGVAGYHAYHIPIDCTNGTNFIVNGTGVDDGIDNAELDLVQLGVYGYAAGGQQCAPRGRVVDQFIAKDSVPIGTQADLTWTNWGNYLIYSPVKPVF